MTHLRPFEKAGLGKAPFRCTGVTKHAYQACQGARQTKLQRPKFLDEVVANG